MQSAEALILYFCKQTIPIYSTIEFLLGATIVV